MGDNTRRLGRKWSSLSICYFAFAILIELNVNETKKQRTIGQASKHSTAQQPRMLMPWVCECVCGSRIRCVSLSLPHCRSSSAAVALNRLSHSDREMYRFNVCAFVSLQFSSIIYLPRSPSFFSSFSFYRSAMREFLKPSICKLCAFWSNIVLELFSVFFFCEDSIGKIGYLLANNVEFSFAPSRWLAGWLTRYHPHSPQR